MAPKSSPSSEEIRQKGNELYKSGNITGSELSPAERTPLSNLSAAYQEIGNYAAAISACDTALALLSPDTEDHDAIKHKHLVRKAKACHFAAHRTTWKLDDYPQLYDRIHLSNVPDYIGGSLTSYLYALPLAYPGEHSYITSTCLRNPQRVPTIASFDAEYVGLHAKDDLEAVFHVRMEPNYDAIMPMCAYNRWHHHIASSEHAKLMPRPKLETWLYRLFLKIAIPLERRMIVDGNLINSPLNLTCFFRLCQHLHAIGYPAHWLGEVISSILSGTVMTKARPPRSEPLKPREIDNTYKELGQSVRPFTAEFSTLVAMWQLPLPFGVLSQNIASVETIERYSMRFKNVSKDVIAYTNFILVFFKGPLPTASIFDLRSCLLSDEKALKDNASKTFRESMINIISTWTWNAPSQTATFWLRSMQAMRDEKWEVCIYRTDNWKPQSISYAISKVKNDGLSWVQHVNGPAGGGNSEQSGVRADLADGDDAWTDENSEDDDDDESYGSGSPSDNDDSEERREAVFRQAVQFMEQMRGSR